METTLASSSAGSAAAMIEASPGTESDVCAGMVVDISFCLPIERQSANGLRYFPFINQTISIVNRLKV